MKINLKFSPKKDTLQTGLQVKSRIKVGIANNPCIQCQQKCKANPDTFPSCIDDCKKSGKCSTSP